MTARKGEVTDAIESLGTYVRQAGGKGPVVVTDDGQTIAALVLLEHTDLEAVALSSDPEFVELIRTSRERHAQEGGLSSAKVLRRLENAPPSGHRSR